MLVPISSPKKEIDVIRVIDLYFEHNHGTYLVNALGLQINDIEPFCQDEIVLYRECAEKRVSNIYVFFHCVIQNSIWSFQLDI